jgi:hypothetical protein
MLLTRFHPEMALFPMRCVLRGFRRACPVECEAYSTGATRFSMPRHKSLCGLAHRKIAHFQIGTYSAPYHINNNIQLGSE